MCLFVKGGDANYTGSGVKKEDRSMCFFPKVLPKYAGALSYVRQPSVW